MRAGFVQINSRILDVEGNVDRALKLIGSKKADLIVIPELFSSGYNFRTRKEVAKVAEPLPGGATTEALKDFSKRDGTIVVAGIAERKDQSFYNSAVVVRDGRYLGKYRKIHLFYNEKKFFKQGNGF
jgi:predicted amidohydrolase